VGEAGGDDHRLNSSNKVSSNRSPNKLSSNKASSSRKMGEDLVQGEKGEDAGNGPDGHDQIMSIALEETFRTMLNRDKVQTPDSRAVAMTPQPPDSQVAGSREEDSSREAIPRVAGQLAEPKEVEMEVAEHTKAPWDSRVASVIMFRADSPEDLRVEMAVAEAEEEEAEEEEVGIKERMRSPAQEFK